MKFTEFIKRGFKFLVYLLVAVVLLVTGVILSLYSPWTQDNLRSKLVERLNAQQGVEFSLESLKVSFPLDISIKGLSYATEGDTLLAAEKLDVSADILSLLTGKIKIHDIEGVGLKYTMGNRDSLTAIKLRADSILLSDASLIPLSMDIKAHEGKLTGGYVNIWINPDSVSTDTTSTESTDMKIAVDRLEVKRLDYSMQLLPTIDSLGCQISEGVLEGAKIDLKGQTVDLSSFTGSGLNAIYLMPDEQTLAQLKPPTTPVQDKESKPWTVKVGLLDFTNSSGLYTTQGYKPLPGLDFSYISVSELHLKVKDFYNQAANVTIPLWLRGKERCGLDVEIAGTLDINENLLQFNDFTLSTPLTHLEGEYLMGSGDILTQPTLPLALEASGEIGMADIEAMFPFTKIYTGGFPADTELRADLNLKGTAGKLNVNKLFVELAPSIRLEAKGRLENVFASSGMGGNIKFNGSVGNVSSLKDLLLGKNSFIDIPPMIAEGNISLHHGDMKGEVQVTARDGSVKLDGDWNANSEKYNASLTARDFPLAAFMPGADVGNITASLDVDGKGYSPFNPSTKISAYLEIASLTYLKHNYSSITGNAQLQNGNAMINLTSNDPIAKGIIEAQGNLNGETYTWQVNIAGDNINLNALGLSNEEASLNLSADADIFLNPSKKIYDVKAKLGNLKYDTPISNISLKDVMMSLASSDTLTTAKINNRDLSATFVSPCGIDSLSLSFADASGLLMNQIASRHISVDSLQRVLPQFDLDIISGNNNFINDLLSSDKMSLDSLNICCKNDSSLNLQSKFLGLSTSTLRLDTVTFAARQSGNHLRIDGAVDNRPGTLDSWAKVRLGGFISGNTLALRLRQYNIKKETGFDIGATLALADSSATLRFMPLFPIINYKTWTLNRDNFITYYFANSHVDANLRMHSSKSKLELFTEHAAGSEEQEDLVVKLSDIDLSDWLSFGPFMPPVKGLVSADLRLNKIHGDLNGKGYAQIDNFIYGKQRVGNFKTDFDVITGAGGKLNAKANLFVDGEKTMTLSGVLNDSTAASPFALDFSMIRFPLRTINPFLPSGTASLRGMLNGTMKISGDSSNPVINGYLDFDSTAVKLALTGMEYKFSDEKIPVENNLVTLDQYTISGLNDSPLTIDGTVDLKTLSNPSFGLNLKTKNIKLVDNRRAAKGADVYGKAFIGLDASVNGNLQLLRVNANLSLNSGTNVTYILPSATSVIENQSVDGMVKFVNFADSSAVNKADSLVQESTSLIIQAYLTLQNGTTVNIDLSPDGKDRVSLQAAGSLDFSMNPMNDGRLSGRININGGFIRYSPPVISEKNFEFQEGSYVSFSGEIMNPMLNIHAVDVIKANVTSEGQDSRLVNFDVGLSVTGPMQSMKVAFDLSTRDDITVENELETMSADQRQSQAINLMLYNVYTGPGTKGDASLSGNPLMSFLSSTANSWLANNIRSVDISLGINQYDRTINGSSSSTMSYSYQVSKSLFNDRFKILVGGSYYTDANADENFSQNLINDISFEYFLNKSRTMYLKLFRHTGYESILEGEVTSTGVGFVYRRKMLHFRNLFRKDKSKKKMVTFTTAPDSTANEKTQKAVSPDSISTK